MRRSDQVRLHDPIDRSSDAQPNESYVDHPWLVARYWLPTAAMVVGSEGRRIGVVNHRPQEDAMESVPLDRAGRRRSPATTSAFHQGVSPANKGLSYPPDPPTVEEIIAVMRTSGSSLEGVRLRGVIVVLWRAGAADQRSARAQ